MKIATEDVVFGVVMIAALYGVITIVKAIYKTRKEIKQSEQILGKK